MKRIREVVNVCIKLNNKIILCKKPTKNGIVYSFPGGGTDGKTHLETIESELLEEIGVEVENVVFTNITLETPLLQARKDPNGGIDYTHSKIFFYSATFKNKNNTRLGQEGDAMDFDLYTTDEAKKYLRVGSPMFYQSQLNVIYKTLGFGTQLSGSW